MKTIHISYSSTSGPGIVGLLLPLSNSYSTHTNLSQHLQEVSDLCRYTRYCPSHFLIFKAVMPGKYSTIKHIFMWSFFILVQTAWIQNMSAYFRNILYKDSYVLHLSAPCLLHVYHKIPLYCMWVFSSILSTNAWKSTFHVLHRN
jgi:Na+/pantothenate symporter